MPKFVRLFDYDDVDGQILYLLTNDIDVLEIQDLLEQRIEQSRKDKLLHTITRLIKILIQLGNKNMQMDEVMILDKAIENLQSNL